MERTGLGADRCSLSLSLSLLVGLSQAADYNLVVGPGPQGLQASFNGSVIAGSAVIDDAVLAEGDIVTVWGTFQKDGYPMDGLIWAGVSKNGAKRGLIIHDRTLGWSNASDMPQDSSGNTIGGLPTYGAWQVLLDVKEASGYTGQSSEGPVAWISESIEWDSVLWWWDNLTSVIGTSEDLSQISGIINNSSYTILGGGLFAFDKYPNYAAGYVNGPSVDADNWLTNAIHSIFDHCPVDGNRIACGKMECPETKEKGGTTTECFTGFCKCKKDGGGTNQVECDYSVPACDNTPIDSPTEYTMP